MVVGYVERLENFLKERFGLIIPAGVKFQKMPQRKLNEWLKKEETVKNKLVNLSMNDFLTDDFMFNPDIEKVVIETIRKEGIIIYAGIVSYDGRGEAALSTGGNTFSNLKGLEQQGLLKRFLSYQGSRDKPSPLCQFAIEQGIKTYFVDEVNVLDKENNELISRKARGKTENVLKFIMLLNREIKQQGLDPNKVFVLFLDDDYTLLDDRAHNILIASWVLSRAKSRVKGVKRLINRCKNAGFIKNGGVRIHFPPFLSHKILRGDVIKNYRSLIIETLKLVLDLGAAEAEASLSRLNKLKRKLEDLSADLVLTPENLSRVVKPRKDATLIKRIMKKYFYSGGRVNKPLTKRNVHEAENFLSFWLGQFTYLLHGDQGASLEDWSKLVLGRGYAMEISIAVQFLMDEKFKDMRIIDIKNTPHAHQPQRQPNIDNMEDIIYLVLEALRVYYNNWDVNSYIARYKKITRVRWSGDGRYSRKKVRPSRGILFYPAAKNLVLSS